ncbi:MAG: putative T7SS-secreted protein [Rhodoglobus sp.]
MSLEPLAGNPVALAARAESLSASARAIQAAAEALSALSFTGSGVALEAAAHHADGLANKITTAHGRYSDTASALQSYAVELDEAHRKASEAIDEAQEGQRQADVVSGNLDQLRNLRDTIEGQDPTDPRLVTIDDALRELTQRRDSFEARVHDATAKLEQAQRDLEAAAEHAMSRIKAALESTNDSIRDKIGDAINKIGDFLSVVTQWITEVFAKILKAILVVIVALVAVVLAAIAIVVIAIAAAAIMAWGALNAGLLMKLLLLSFLIPGMEAWRFRVLSMIISIMMPVLGALVLWRILSDVLSPTPKVTKVGKEDLTVLQQLTTVVQQFAQNKAENIKHFHTLEDYMLTEECASLMGESDRTVIDIRKVIGPDGVERWVVALPGTGDWQVTNGGKPATNDLDGNLALFLSPEMQTKYERAVLEAMDQAGIKSDDEVMLVGFSQGGILAGHLAAHRSNEYNFSSVLAYGAPIDAMNIPEKTKLLSIQHTGDAVPMLDLTSPRPNTMNHVTVSVAPYDGTFGPLSHENIKYRDTAVHSPALSAYQDYFHSFSGTVTKQDHYTWKE